MLDHENQSAGKRDRSTQADRHRLFTEIGIAKLRLRPGEKQVAFRDKKKQGLILRINSSGRKSWLVSFYDKSRSTMRSEKLGEFRPDSSDHMSLKGARDAADNFRANRTTILAERAKNAAARSDTFEVVAERYLKRFVDGKRRSGPQMRKMIEKIYPVWGKKPFEAIKRSDVSDLLDDIEVTRGPRAADVTLATLRRMMSKYAVGHDDYSSPIREGMARIENPSERARDRILSDEEIQVMFRACEGQGVFGNLAKMLLLTAQRRTKVASMSWDDVSEDVWTIATEDREKGNAGRLKLSKLALAVVDAQRETRTNNYVFPASFKTSRADPSRPYGSFSAFGDGKAALDKAMADILPNIPHWTLHDLRRTARSLMSRAGVRPDIAERVLGHAIPGVQGVYDRHAYDRERAQALASLATLIGRILDGKAGNVVPLVRSKRS
jgi:integrase